MRLFLLTIVSLLVITSTSFSQQHADLSRLMKKSLFTCEDLGYNCLHLIPSYYTQQKFDSVSFIISYWKERCGANEQVLRMEILLRLREKSFDEKDYGPLLPVFLQRYRDRKTKSGGSEHELIRVAQEQYDTFTQKIAKEIELKYAVGSVESAICNYYMNDFRDFDNLVAMNVVEKPTHWKAKTEDVEPNLDSVYSQSMASLTLNLKLSLFTGLWNPIGNLRTVGTQYVLGAAAGVAIPSQGGLDVSLAYASSGGEFQNLTIGIEPYGVVAEPSESLKVLSSLGFAFDWLTRTGDENFNSHRSNGFNFGVGLQQEVSRKNGTYIGAQLRYHLLDYPPQVSNSLTGDAISIRLIYGAMASFKQ